MRVKNTLEKELTKDEVKDFLYNTVKSELDEMYVYNKDNNTSFIIEKANRYKLPAISVKFKTDYEMNSFLRGIAHFFKYLFESIPIVGDNKLCVRIFQKDDNTLILESKGLQFNLYV